LIPGYTKRYKETLQYMFSKLPMYQRVGSVAYKKDLTNIVKLCNYLGNPHLKFPCIHIAGTNGKGSTSHLLAAAFQTKKYKTGLYVSPHYKDYRERIKIDGKYIPVKFVVDFIEELKPIIEEINPSFFELNVAMAFAYFASKNVDIAIIETGLGGRLDSTNIIKPVLSVITNISYDHMSLLGETLPEIAFEKAGIIKEGIPVVIGEKQAEVATVFEKRASEHNAKLYNASDHFKAELKESNPDYDVFDIYKDNQLIFEGLKFELKGSFQTKNMLTVLATLAIYNELHPGFFKTEDIYTAFANVKSLTNFIGRWQILMQKPMVIADSGHNEAGIANVIDQLNSLHYNKLHMVIGVVNDKDIDKMLAMFPHDASYYFAKANIPRGLDAKLLREKAKRYNLKGKAFSSVNKAYKAALVNAAEDDLIFIGGSTFVVAEVL